jgi:Fe-S-cluster containining protein
MNPDQKREWLFAIYEEFERDAALWKKDALCGPGCSYCCTHFGIVDVTTLEASNIHAFVMRSPDGERDALLRGIAANRELKLAGRAAPCPFLAEDQTCRIYAVRPFSCRQIYSVRPCGATGATVHRAARELVETTIPRLQALDDTGYSGHVSFVLALLDRPGFIELYRAGGFNPEAVADVGREYRLVINRVMTRSG